MSMQLDLSEALSKYESALEQLKRINKVRAAEDEMKGQLKEINGM